jgi:hypothetical protein
MVWMGFSILLGAVPPNPRGIQTLEKIPIFPPHLTVRPIEVMFVGHLGKRDQFQRKTVKNGKISQKITTHRNPLTNPPKQFPLNKQIKSQLLKCAGSLFRL